MGVIENKDLKNNENSNMENSTYEVIKKRLQKQGDGLRHKVEKLNEKRKDIFGSIDTKLLSSERIITDHNCIPRDMAPVKNSFIFGYNVHIGLKSKVELSDVFAVYGYENGQFQKRSLELIEDDKFIRDFEDLYKYYKGTFFAKFTIVEPYFYMIFQTGKTGHDIKVFKWIIEGDKLRYIDSRSDHEVRFQSGSCLEFIKATRDDQRSGRYPHVSIMDKVFVETLNGDLTVKIEDNTTVGKGIYSEEVEDKDQTLDDAEIYYADLKELIVLKIRPFKEKEYRYFIFNNKLKNVIRIDSIKDTCMLLPGDHGIIFPQGYYLLNGEHKVFDVPSGETVFDQRITSSNGEDFQYIFYNIESGIYLVYSYNVIEQTIETPIICSGYSHFDNGEMIVFKHESEPRQNHMVQIWQTPYVGKNFVSKGKKDSALFDIGNKEIVNCMADCKIVQKLIQKGEGYQSIYFDIVKQSEQILDAYFWVDKEEAFNLRESIEEVKETAKFAIGEFEKVQRIKSSTKKEIEAVEKDSHELLDKIQYGTFENIDEYVKILSEIRALRGRIVSLKDLRYTDLNLVEEMDKGVREKNEQFSQKCVEFLLQPEGLKVYSDKVDELGESIADISKSKEGRELQEEMDSTSEELELLIDIVGNFKIDDPTMTTEIIDKISSLFSLLNNSKARLKNKIDDFSKNEMTTQFNSQMKLLSQAVVNYLDVSDTAEKCDQYLNKVLVQIQELEGKFSEFDEYVMKLTEKREEMYTAFESRKQILLDKLNRRIMALFSSSERMISGILSRLKGFKSVQEINGYLATDMMAEKVRDTIAELRDLGDNVKADEITSKLKNIREDTIRQLKDKQELYLDGEDVIKLGKHHFSVNTKAVDLSVVNKEDGLYYHITGTDFWDKVAHEGIQRFKHVYDQSVPSENNDVYRGEYLAYSIFEEALKEGTERIDKLLEKTDKGILEKVQRYMEPRYQDGYTKGVHDMDAAKILVELLKLHSSIDLLVFRNENRAAARVFWKWLIDEDVKKIISKRLNELSKVARFFKSAPSIDRFKPMVYEEMKKSFEGLDIFQKSDFHLSAEYLCRELMSGEGFAVSREAKTLVDGLYSYLREKDALSAFKGSLNESEEDTEGMFFIAREWILSYIKEGDCNILENLDEWEMQGIIDEATSVVMDSDEGRNVNVEAKVEIANLVGNHKNIDGGVYVLRYSGFIKKMKYYCENVVPLFKEFQDIKKELVKNFKKELHLDDFKPKVLASFVRNKLIDKVYLHLIGDNLAKQMGVVGADKRTDLMGMLLLVSPPGYGKTTLMEYVASRLGIILVKVNGPSLGHEVTSLDPAKADNTSAKDELRKLNLALKMGNNVMIYVDDIQHCNPEFLQKFISLCDGQRKIEGVYKGEGQTYDLRGKKVAVVMSGNPYTESGEKFKIPDMLSNRADVYNLGDMLKENEEAFKLSYIENSLTSNPILSNSQMDIRKISMVWLN